MDTQFTDIATFAKYAKEDKLTISNNEGLGYYKCFCQLHGKKPEYASECGMFTEDMKTAFMLTNIVTALVSGINYFLRGFNIKLIDTIGIEREDVRTLLIMKCIFITTFINTAIILLLTNADLQYSVLSFLPISNQYADLDKNWYADIGPTIVQSMIIMALFPIIGFVSFYGMKVAFRFLDSGFYCCANKRSTKTKTIK